jgi:hypothetical protein
MRRWLSSSRAFGKCSGCGRERTTNPIPRGFAIGVVSPLIILLNVHMQVIVIGTKTRTEKKIKKKYYRKKKGSEAHVVREWDSNESSADSSSDKDTTNIAINKGLLFSNIGHKCLMAKEGKIKVQPRTIPSILLYEDIIHYYPLTKTQMVQLAQL